MSNKKIVGSLAAFFLLTVFSYAQEWPSAANIVTKMQTELNLSQDQLTKVKIIIEQNMTERQQVKPQLAAGLTQAQADPLDSELYTKLSEVLTRSQMHQWESIHQGILDNSDENNK